MTRAGAGIALVGVAVAVLAVMIPAPATAWEHNIADWPERMFPIPIALRPESTPNTSNETLQEIVQASVDEWNSVTCATVELDYTGVADLPIEVDGDQVLAWFSDEDAWIYGSQAAGATIIDVLMFDDRPAIDIAFNAVTFDWIVGASTYVTPDYEFGVDPPLQLDPMSVVTHELGHFLGLGHPNPNVEGSEPDSLATMVFALLPAAQQGTLAADDKLGLCEKYPQEVDECASDDDCREGERCDLFSAEFGDVMLCEEVRDSFGESCGRDRFNCGGLCLPTALDYSGICTEECTSDDDCPAMVEDEAWVCATFPTSDGGELDLCVPESLEPEPSDEGGGPGVVDDGQPEIGIVPDDVGAEPEPDVPDEETSTPDTTDEPEPDAPSDDAGDDDGTGSGGGGGGCAVSPVASTGWGAWALAALTVARRRRK